MRTARTNNISEGYNNRLQIVISKHHPRLCAFLVKSIKEQGDAEIMIRQIQVGQKVKNGQDPKRKKKRRTIFTNCFNVSRMCQQQRYINVFKSLRT